MDDEDKFPPRRVSLFDELDRVFKAMQQVMNGEELAPGWYNSRGTFGTKKESASSSTSSQDGPDTFDDLYNAVSSAFAKGEKSLSALFRHLQDLRDRPLPSNRHLPFPDETPPPPAVFKSKDERLEKKETTERHVDAFGYLHTKTVVRILNEDGEEVGRETSYSIRPAELLDKNDAVDNGMEAGGGSHSSEEAKDVGVFSGGKDKEGEKRGWFWK